MPIADILRLGLDTPRMTPQQIADQALIADREARRLAKEGHEEAWNARDEADAIADEFNRRG